MFIFVSVIVLSMQNELIFSWAENASGVMVHVDEVPQGRKCGCVCPRCHEKLLARHGNIREHGFAHCSDKRGANLKICYAVTLYKLAEQIVKDGKRIFTPAYYGIYKEREIEFVEVKTDSRYEREDKQPDVIALGKDGKEYLIEFVFKEKIQHKRNVDYKNLICLEIDLYGQTLETVKDFLQKSPENRKWINNNYYFEGIEKVYEDKGKQVKVVCDLECCQCDFRDNCCAVKINSNFLSIENNGNNYRLCKREEFEKKKAGLEKLKLDVANRRERIKKEKELENSRNLSERSCFYCKSNLRYLSSDSYVCCGMGKPHRVSLETARSCRGFRRGE